MLATLASAAAAPNAVPQPPADAFVQWKGLHGKLYRTADAEHEARLAFFEADAYIARHNNAKNASFTLAHNAFSDTRPATRVGGYRRRSNATAPLADAEPVEQLRDIPASIDWVARGAVGPVQQQGQCGSCWAFSAAGAIEAALFIDHGALKTLSVEELVQCDPNSEGCTGGSPASAFDFVREHGIVSDAAYPYTSSTGVTGTCDAAKESGHIVAKLTGYRTPSTYAAIKAAVAQQPVAAGINAEWTGFQQYSGGIISAASASECDGALNHGVLLVGYGTDAASGVSYWKAKNQWGAAWGDGGYFKIEAGIDLCNVESDIAYPVGVHPYSTIPLPPLPPFAPPPPSPPTAPGSFWTDARGFVERAWDTYFDWFRGLPGVKALSDDRELQVALACIALTLAAFIAFAVARCATSRLCCKRRREARMPVAYGSPLLEEGAPRSGRCCDGHAWAEPGRVPMGTAVVVTTTTGR